MTYNRGMKDIYAFGDITVRRAESRESNKLTTLTVISDMQREGLIVTAQSLEKFQQKYKVKDNSRDIPDEDGELLEALPEQDEDTRILFPTVGDLDCPWYHIFVVETPLHTSAYPILTFDRQRQIGGHCTNRAVKDEDGIKRWVMHGFHPVESDYSTAECLLAATIHQAIAKNADIIEVETTASSVNFFKNKALFYKPDDCDKAVLASRRFGKVLNHLSNETGLNFNF